MNQEPTLDGYLHGNALNITIYKELQKNYAGLFEPLQFFNDLYNTYNFFEQYQENYYLIETEFSTKIQLEGLQRYFFLLALTHVIAHYHSSKYEDTLIFSPAGEQSYNYINELLAEVNEELSAKDEPEQILEAGRTEITPIDDKTQIKLSYTNSQLVLIFYYFLKNSGLELRTGIDVAPVAKFMHLITGKDFKGTTSSDFYQKLLKAPNFKKTEKETIKDLEAIKPLFQKVQLNNIVTAIEKEIDIAKSELIQPKK